MEEKITWDLIDKIIEDIANKINSSNFNIEYIAPIPKGGWTVAALLAQRLNVKTMALWVIPSFNGNLPDYYFNIGNIPEFPWEIKY